MQNNSSTRRAFLLAAGAGALGAAGTSQAQHHPAEPYSPAAAEKMGQAFPFLALKVVVEVESAATQGVVSIIRVFVPAGEGPPPHVHSREDEIHTVVRGHYRYRHGDMEIDAPAGTIIFMPRGSPHVFRNVGDEPGEHLVQFIPGGLEQMFREVSAAGVQMPRDSAKYDEISAKYGIRNLSRAELPLSAPKKAT